MQTLTKKIDFAIIIDVVKANPNGDPLDSNRPRVDFDGFGEISDVCLKRKIRDRAIDSNIPVFVVSAEKESDGCKSLHDRFDSFLKRGGKADIKSLCTEWFDVRTFGQVFAFKKKTKTNESTNDDSVSLPIRGPVTIQCATSIEPVSVSSMQITKSVNSETTESGKKSSDTMGTKHRIDRGIYVSYGAMSPQLAEKTGFTDADAELLKKLIIGLFNGDASSARPEGSMSVRYLIWWEQDASSQKYSSYKIHQSLRNILKSNKDVSYDNLTKNLSNVLDGLVPEIVEGR